MRARGAISSCAVDPHDPPGFCHGARRVLWGRLHRGTGFRANLPPNGPPRPCPISADSSAALTEIRAMRSIIVGRGSRRQEGTARLGDGPHGAFLPAGQGRWFRSRTTSASAVWATRHVVGADAQPPAQCRQQGRREDGPHGPPRPRARTRRRLGTTRHPPRRGGTGDPRARRHVRRRARQAGRRASGETGVRCAGRRRQVASGEQRLDELAGPSRRSRRNPQRYRAATLQASSGLVAAMARGPTIAAARTARQG